MTRQRVRAEEHGIDQQDHRAEAHAEPVGEIEGTEPSHNRIKRERDGQVEEVAMDVLQDEREPGLPLYAGRASRTAHAGGDQKKAR